MSRSFDKADFSLPGIYTIVTNRDSDVDFSPQKAEQNNQKFNQLPQQRSSSEE